MLNDFECNAIFLIAEIEHQISCGKQFPWEVISALNIAKKYLSEDAKKLASAHKLAVKLN